MSSTITSPINIKTTNVKCQNTCLYSFNYDYANSSCTITNGGDHLKFSYDAPASIIIYNDVNYHVEDIRLYKPSVNEYYNSPVDAELIINHSGDGGMNVIVCVPLIASDGKSKSNTLFNQLIPNAPLMPADSTESSGRVVNVQNYSLNSFLPHASYYSYTGTLPYQTSHEPNNIIIFDSQKVSINMSTSNMDTLGTIISPPSNIPPINNSYNINHLYYNTVGTTEDELGDDIYIDCQLLDSSGDVVQEGGQPGAAKSTFDLSDLQNNIGVDIFLGFAAVVGMWAIYRAIRNWVAPTGSSGST